MKHLLVAATALTMLSGAALAQTSNSNANSMATNSSGSASRAGVVGTTIGNGTSQNNLRNNSRSAAVGNNTNVTVQSYAGIEGYTGGSGSGGSGTGDPVRGEQYIGYGGGYTLRNTPEVIAPSVVGGNPCSIGVSGGVSLPGFGLAGGATWADAGCERRQVAALMFNMGEKSVAFEVMCQDSTTRSAMKIAGKPCAADLPPVTAAAAAVQPAPASVAALSAPRPEWCNRAAPTTEASKAYAALMCGG